MAWPPCVSPVPCCTPVPFPHTSTHINLLSFSHRYQALFAMGLLYMLFLYTEMLFSQLPLGKYDSLGLNSICYFVKEGCPGLPLYNLVTCIFSSRNSSQLVPIYLFMCLFVLVCLPIPLEEEQHLCCSLQCLRCPSSVAETQKTLTE